MGQPITRRRCGFSSPWEAREAGRLKAAIPGAGRYDAVVFLGRIAPMIEMNASV
jgi:hypothetical protein